MQVVAQLKAGIHEAKIHDLVCILVDENFFTICVIHCTLLLLALLHNFANCTHKSSIPCTIQMTMYLSVPLPAVARPSVLNLPCCVCSQQLPTQSVCMSLHFRPLLNRFVHI